MFEATGWTFASGDGEVPVVLRSPSGGEYTLLQRYDFDHTRMTQSVVVRAPDGAQEIFVKGSFEKIGALCRPGSLTAEHGAIARSHAMNGCYVLALASRSLGMAGAEVRKREEGAEKEREVEMESAGRALVRVGRSPNSRKKPRRSPPSAPFCSAPQCGLSGRHAHLCAPGALQAGRSQALAAEKKAFHAGTLLLLLISPPPFPGRARRLEALKTRRHRVRPDLQGTHHLPQRAAAGLGRNHRGVEGEREEWKGGGVA